MSKEKKWLPLFESFIKELRISSKEIASEDERGAPLNLWTSQRMALEAVCDGMEEGIRNFVFLKSRQLGISTVFLAIDIFWLAVHPGTIGALVTESETNRAIFRETIERYVASFPKGFLGSKFAIKRANKDFVLFSNGSRLDFIVAGTRRKTNWGEGRGYALVHGTEVASYGSEEGMASFRETLAEQNPNRLFIWESTAKGFNMYREMWQEYGRDEYTKKRTFLGWWSKEINEIPKTDRRFKAYGVTPPDAEERELIEAVQTQYNFKVTPEKLAWYRWRAAEENQGIQAMHQNQPWTAEQAFVMTGFSFFQVRVLQKDMERCANTGYLGYRYWLGNDFWAGVCEPITDEIRVNEVQLRVWEEPQEDAEYVIGCDPAYGRNDWKDRSAVSVWRCFADRLVQVAEYADNNVETRQAAWVLAHLAGAYRNCIVNVELTGGPGRAVLSEFENLQQRMRASPTFDEDVAKNKNWEDFLQNARWYLYHRPDNFGAGYVKCWETTGRSKFEIMNQLRDNYSTQLIVAQSTPMIEEMLSVVQDGSEIGAPGKAKDDRVFAMALANRAWIDHMRMGLIAQGKTFDSVMNTGTEQVDFRDKMVNNIIQNFFKNAEADADQPTDEQQWLMDRGFA